MRVRRLSSLHDFILVHQWGAEQKRLETDSSCFNLATCLRTIHLIPARQSETHLKGLLDVGIGAQYEVLEGHAAYSKVLEITCGLLSPMVGETEVFGQFKTAVKQFEDEAMGKGIEASILSAYRNWFQCLLEDTKRIRSEFLTEQGSQSYGSLARRMIRDWKSKEVVLVGSGQLVQEIAPWLLKNGKVMVSLLARSIDRARDLQSRLVSRDANAKIEVLRFHTDSVVEREFTEPEVTVIVCAPIEASRLAKYAAFQNHSLNLIDLRAESGIDDLATQFELNGIPFQNCVRLQEFFQMVEISKAKSEKLKSEALAAIAERSLARAETESYARAETEPQFQTSRELSLKLQQ